MKYHILKPFSFETVQGFPEFLKHRLFTPTIIIDITTFVLIIEVSINSPWKTRRIPRKYWFSIMTENKKGILRALVNS